MRSPPQQKPPFDGQSVNGSSGLCETQSSGNVTQSDSRMDFSSVSGNYSNFQKNIYIGLSATRQFPLDVDIRNDRRRSQIAPKCRSKWLVLTIIAHFEDCRSVCIIFFFSSFSHPSAQSPIPHSHAPSRLIFILCSSTSLRSSVRRGFRSSIEFGRAMEYQIDCPCTNPIW